MPVIQMVHELQTYLFSYIINRNKDVHFKENADQIVWKKNSLDILLNFSFYIPHKKNVIRVWNDIRLNNSQNFQGELTFQGTLTCV